MIRKLLFLFLLVAGSLTDLFAQGSFVISGKLPQLSSDDLALVVDVNHLHRRTHSYNSKIVNNNFSFKADISRDYFIELLNPEFRFPLYVSPGDSLVLTFIASPTPSISLTGKGSNDNNFLQVFLSKFQSEFNDSISEALASSMTVDAFETKIFTQKKTIKDYLKSDQAYVSCSENFKTFITNMIEYNYWKQLFSYPIINANKSQQILKVTPLPDVMLTDFSKVRVVNDKALVAESYRTFLKYYIIYETSKANGFNKFTDLSVSADRKSAVARDRLSGEVLAYWLTKFVIDECERISPFMTNKIYESVKEFDKENKYQQIVIDVCGAKMNSKEKDSPAENKEKGQVVKSDELGLTTLDGKPFSLSSLKGKVVYIDYWASWCGPCRQMMPFSKQLHDGLTEKEKKNIVFLYISIDGKLEAWKQAITDLGMEGVQVVSPGNWSSKVCAYFQINSIPRYMIMDKTGTIVDYNAKRPNDPSLVDQLRSLQ